MIEYKAIGVIHTPYLKIEGMPIQPSGDTRGRVEVFPQYRQGLRDLAGFSHVILLYHFHRASGFDLVVTPFLDPHPHGIFSTRAPKRPNPIGLSVVRLKAIEENVLYVEGVDMLDETPLIDIKPYVPQFDAIRGAHIGWLKEVVHGTKKAKADSRFE